MSRSRSRSWRIFLLKYRFTAGALIGALLMCFSLFPLLSDESMDLRDEFFTRDARLAAMGGAFTAAGDSVHALYFNPAGLAYLSRPDVQIGNSTYVDFNHAGMNDFLAVAEGEQPDPFTLFFNHMSNTLQASAAGRFWGVSFTHEVAIVPPETASLQESSIPFSQVTRSTIAGGLAAALGDFSFGFNLRHVRSDESAAEFSTSDYIKQVAGTGSFLDGTSRIRPESLVIPETAPVIQAGVGIMTVTGGLTTGIYVDSIYTGESMSFQERIDRMTQTASIGMSYDFFNPKREASHHVRHFVISADLHRAGDDDRRFLSFGTEAGLHFTRVITLDLRGGYTHPVPGSTLTEAFTSLDPAGGEVHIGAGMKFMVSDLHLSLSLPVRFLQDVMQDGFDFNDPDFGTLASGSRVVISGGVRL